MHALDLFAGTGWGVACRWLGIEESGVDNMPAVIKTREHNGMHTAYHDVWDGLVGEFGYEYVEHDLLIASPPCQTFSMAGRGSGRDALDKVLMLILEEAYKRPAELMAFGTEDGIDPRTALVLSPLAHVWRDRPTYVTFEQVPPVLPVWEACAAEMRKWGYSVWVGYLHAEQYGVPQTRKRAILMARRDGFDAHPPKPTHSKFHSRNPSQLDPGVEKWVSMAEALGWGMTERPLSPLRSNYGTGGEPAATMTGKAGRNKWADGRNLALEEAAVFQSYPMGWGFTHRPAVTVTGHGLITRHPTGQKQAVLDAFDMEEFIPRPPYTVETARIGENPAPGEYISLPSVFEPDAVNLTPEEAAILQTFPFERQAEQYPWMFNRPATTVAGEARLAGPGRSEFVKGGVSRQDRPGSTKISTNEAAVLQSYPRFEFVGTRTQQFLQIGNAVPPLLAYAILKEFQ